MDDHPEGSEATSATVDDLALRVFLTHCGREAFSAASSSSVRRGAERFVDRIGNAAATKRSGCLVPALEDRHDLAGGALCDEAIPLLPSFRWQPSFRLDDDGTTVALAPIRELFDLGALDAGLLYVRRGATYPTHHHRPQELYLTIGGAGSWRVGGADGHVIAPPGTTMYNRPNDEHEVVAVDGPVLAFYVLWPDIEPAPANQ